MYDIDYVYFLPLKTAFPKDLRKLFEFANQTTEILIQDPNHLESNIKSK